MGGADNEHGGLLAALAKYSLSPEDIERLLVHRLLEVGTGDDVKEALRALKYLSEHLTAARKVAVEEDRLALSSGGAPGGQDIIDVLSVLVDGAEKLEG